MDKVLEDTLVDVGERAVTGALLLYAGGTGGLAQHPALCDEDDVALGELLLQLSCQSAHTESASGLRRDVINAPLLDFPECLQLGDRHEDHDGLLSALDVDFTRRGDLEGAELSLELGDVVFEINERLADGGLDLVRGGGGRVGRAENLGRHRGRGGIGGLREEEWSDWMCDQRFCPSRHPSKSQPSIQPFSPIPSLFRPLHLQWHLLHSYGRRWGSRKGYLLSLKPGRCTDLR